MFGKKEQMPSIQGEMKKQEEVETVRAELERLYVSQDSDAYDRIVRLETRLAELKPDDYTQLEGLRDRRNGINVQIKMLNPQSMNHVEYEHESNRLHKAYDRITAEIKRLEGDSAKSSEDSEHG